MPSFCSVISLLLCLSLISACWFCFLSKNGAVNYCHLKNFISRDFSSIAVWGSVLRDCVSVHLLSVHQHWSQKKGVMWGSVIYIIAMWTWRYVGGWEKTTISRRRDTKNAIPLKFSPTRLQKRLLAKMISNRRVNCVFFLNYDTSSSFFLFGTNQETSVSQIFDL